LQNKGVQKTNVCEEISTLFSQISITFAKSLDQLSMRWKWWV